MTRTMPLDCSNLFFPGERERKKMVHVVVFIVGKGKIADADHVTSLWLDVVSFQALES